MTLFEKLIIISMVIGIPSATVTAPGHSDHTSKQVLVVGAQKDFKAAAEGKLLVFDTLVALDETGNLRPRLATSWTVSPDGKEWVLTLRRGVTYHDGTPFNARAAKFSIEKAMAGAVWAKYVDEIKIVAAHTLKVIFNTYYHSFLREMANGWLSENFVCPAAVDPPWDPNGRILRYIGTGPFKLGDYKKDREATLVRNDTYWGKTPKLTKILWKYTPDPYAQILALKAGELDIIGAPEHHSSVPFMKLAELAADADFAVSTHSYGRYQVLEFNCRRPPFDDVSVRKAFNYAIDRQKMVRSLFGTLTDPSFLITDPKFKWGPSNITAGYRYDKKRAVQLLAQAGWGDTNGDGLLDRNGNNFEIDLLVPTGEANADMVALVVQSQLKDMGIRLNIKTLANAWDKQQTGEYDLFLHHSGCLPSIPGGIGIGGKYHSKGWPYAFHSDKLDALIASAFTSTDESKSRANCDAIWRLLQDANPCIPLYDITKAVIMSKRVQGFKHGPTMFDMDLIDVSVVQ